MKFNYEWYLSDGSVLKGETAKKHLLAKLHSYKELMKDIDCILSRSLENNHIVKENTLPNTVMFTAEALSIIQIELEMLSDRMDDRECRKRCVNS